MLQNILGKAKQAALTAVGLDVRRRRDDIGFHLQRSGCKTVLDIGANTGQFAAIARKACPSAHIICFEPLPKPYQQLLRTIQDDQFTEAIQLGLGDIEGDYTINVSQFSPSSSFLPQALAHVRAFPFAATCTTQTVRVARLDDWVRTRAIDHPIAVKIDVQGYEDRVILGGHDTISEAALLIIEISYRELYQGQLTFDPIYAMVSTLGYKCVGITNNGYDPRTGELLQSDAIFRRS